jgi:benzoyl-CoA reductase/2-hydroxyglutaryl-CoA dehydratase subunit BcrC/BadD/HgdB
MDIFYASPWVPVEWIKAHGFEPRGVWFADGFAFDPVPLSAGICAFAQAVERFAERHSEGAVIFTTHCDQLRRGFDAVARSVRARVFLFNLPATWQTRAAQQLYAAEIDRLGTFLAGLGGHAPTEAELQQVVASYGDARRRLLEAASTCPARAYAEAIARFHWDGSVCFPAQTAVCPTPAVPLALVGGPLPRSQWGLLDLIEDAGGRVALNATEAGERSLGAGVPAPSGVWSLEGFGSGERPLSEPLSEPLSQPLSQALLQALSVVSVSHVRDKGCDKDEAPAGCARAATESLARTYLENCVDVFQRPNTRLYAWLKERLGSRQVRGIVLWHYVGCDLWRAEAQPLREAFGLPLLLLEAGETAGGSLRQTGRVEAFLESFQ